MRLNVKKCFQIKYPNKATCYEIWDCWILFGSSQWNSWFGCYHRYEPKIYVVYWQNCNQVSTNAELFHKKYNRFKKTKYQTTPVQHACPQQSRICRYRMVNMVCCSFSKNRKHSTNRHQKSCLLLQWFFKKFLWPTAIEVWHDHSFQSQTISKLCFLYKVITNLK